jgi:hypothetical protein
MLSPNDTNFVAVRCGTFVVAGVRTGVGLAGRR